MSRCPTGALCGNQRFQKRQYPKNKLIHTRDRGFGLQAAEPIATDTFVHEYVGEIITHAENQARLKRYAKEGAKNYYLLTLDDEYVIDAGTKCASLSLSLLTVTVICRLLCRSYGQ